jgi:hypothetical protein
MARNLTIPRIELVAGARSNQLHKARHPLVFTINFSPKEPGMTKEVELDPAPRPGGAARECDGVARFVLRGRLTPLIPPPRAHQIRHHGVLAPCSSGRES